MKTSLLFLLLTSASLYAQQPLDTVRVESARIIRQQLDRMSIPVSSQPLAAGLQAFDLLNITPGVQVEEDGTISLRGKSGVTVYLNNRPIRMSGSELVSFLRSLPAASIESLELMTNPPARYQSNGTAGIIVIRLKRSGVEGWSGQLQAGMGQGIYPRVNTSTSLAYRHGKLSAGARLFYNYSGNFYKVIRERRSNNPSILFLLQQNNREHNRRGSAGVQASLDFAISSSIMLGFSYTAYYSPYREGGVYRTEFIHTDLDSVLRSQSFLQTKTQHHLPGFTLEKKYARGNISLSGDLLLYSDERNQELLTKTDHLASSASDTVHLKSMNQFKASVFGLSLDQVHRFHSDLQGEWGAQLSMSDRSVSNAIRTIPLTFQNSSGEFFYRESITALYASMRQTIGRWKLQGGLRLEHQQGTTRGKDFDAIRMDNTTTLFPTAYISYDLDSFGNKQFQLNGSRRVTRPDYQDLNPSVFYFDRYQANMGNRFLVPQYAWQLELAWQWGNRLRAGGNLNVIRNAITQVYSNFSNVLTLSSTNLRAYRQYGIFSNVLIRPTSFWSLQLFPQLNYDVYVGKSAFPLHMTQWSFRMNMQQQFRLPKGWTMDLTGLYRTRILYGQMQIGAGWQLHASVQKKWKATRLTLSGRDVFRSWILDRDVVVDGTSVHWRNSNDSRYAQLTWSFEFGKQVAGRSRKAAVATEAARAGAN